jgi:hypothetical protein
MNNYPKQLNTIDELLEYVKTAINNDIRFVIFDELDEQEIEKLFAISGFDLQNYRRIIDSYGIIHALNKHGKETVEKQRGQIAITLNDFLLVPKIAKMSDKIVYQFEVSTKRHVLLYEKILAEGKFVYAEEIRIGKKKNLVLMSLRLHKIKTF